MFVVLLKTLVFSLYYFLWFGLGVYLHKDYVIKCFVGTHYTQSVKQRYKFECERFIIICIKLFQYLIELIHFRKSLGDDSPLFSK